MAFPAEKTYTIEQFEAFLRDPENRDRHFELIDGAIVEKAMPTDEHNRGSVGGSAQWCHFGS